VQKREAESYKYYNVYFSVHLFKLWSP